MKKLREIPQFKTQKEERAFWEKEDSTDYLDWSKAKVNVPMPLLKPSVRRISLRLSESLLNELRILANKRDVPYQSLIKIILQERVDRELHNR